MNDKIKPKTLTPFRRFCMTIGELPSSYLETMSYYEMLLWFTKYLGETVIPAVNNNAEALEEAQKVIEEMKEYMDNYFDNLNIQNEINNKLDDMAESGQLVEIIGQYLETSAILGFDTKADLKGADNLIDGSITKTLGDLTYGDGKGQFYKIRTKTELDVVDDDNILALTNFNDLIAEKIPYSNGYNLQKQIDDITQKKTMIVIGDSFSNSSQSGTPLWYTYVANALNLNVYTNASDGQGYGTGENNFLVQLQTANTYFTDKSIIDRIYIMGGLNDLGNTSGLATELDFQTEVSNVLNYAISNFPNIPIYVYGILPFQFYNFYGGTNYLPEKRATAFTEVLSYEATTKPNVFFVQCSSFGLFSPDYFGAENIYHQRHPSAIGEKAIANLVMTGQRFYGVRNINNGEQCPTLSTVLPITSGTASSVDILGADLNYIYLRINDYDNSTTLQIDLSRLPVNINKFTQQYQYVVTDQDNTIMGWIGPFTDFIIPANKLNSGSLYINIPYNPLW